MSTTKVQSDMIDDNAVDETKLKDALVGDYTEVTVATGDSILLGDVDDSGNTKRDTVQGILDLASGGGFTLGTEQATTSGTSVTFGSIPSGVTMIIISFVGVSLTSIANIDVTIGDAGGIETSGYVSASVQVEAASPIEASSSTAEFLIYSSNHARTFSGQMILTLENASTFYWSSSHSMKEHTVIAVSGGGDKALSAELTQLTISGGTFDAGAINIMYQ